MTDELQGMARRNVIPTELLIPEFRNILDEIETIQNATGGRVTISFGGSLEGIEVSITREGRTVTFVVEE